MKMRQRLESDSIVWIEAQKALREQARRREALKQLFDAIPSSGLYQDDDSDCCHLKDFVAHLCQTLARAPRTVLLQSLEEAFRLLQMRHSDDMYEELKRGLNLHLADGATSSTIQQFVRAVGAVKEGHCFQQVQKLRQSLANPPCSMEETRKKIMGQITTKAKNGVPLSESQIESAVANAMEKDSQRRQRAQHQLAELEDRLKSDKEYSHYQRMHLLWKECGGCALWENYKAASLAVSQYRGERGKAFEDKSSALCFAMVVLLLQDNNDEPPLQEYSYERNAHWWRNGKNIGEVDLLVYHNDTPVVICEMKSSAFEIARAPQQHESKIQQAKKEAEWRIGSTLDASTKVESELLFFVATLLPPSRNQVGADPTLANAICEGIRAQGARIAHPSTIPLCRPIAELLLLDSSSPVEVIMEQLQSIQPMTSTEAEEYYKGEGFLDYRQLEGFVRDKMDPADLALSPYGCFERLSERLLVLPPM